MKHATRFSYLFIAITTCALLSSATFANAAGHHARLKRQEQKQQRLLAAAAAGNMHAAKMLERFGADAGAVAPAGVSLAPLAPAAARTWNNTGTDFNAAASWTGGAPGADDVGLFAAAPITQPVLSAPITIAGLRFSAGTSGYIIGNSGSNVLTLNGVDVSGGGGTTTASASAFRNDNTTGTITVNDTPINLAPSTGISTIFQDAGDGSTLILNVPIGQTGTVALSLKNGTIQLNNANSYSGGTSIDAAGTTLVVGNDSALGTGTFTNGATSTFQAGSGPHTLANNVVLAGNMTVSGGNAVTFNGSFTSSGSSSRTLTVSNTGGTTLGGSVFLSEDNATAGRIFIINGSTATTINGVITNNGVGNTVAAGLRYSGTSTLTLNNANTYAGGTSITVSGTIIANADGALGTGNVSLTAGAVSLTLQNGATQNYIANAASLSIVTGTGTVFLNYSGTDTIGTLTLNGVGQAAGQWGAIGSGAANTSAAFSGTGFINVATAIPEPSTWMMIGVGAVLLAGVQRFRRK